MKVRGKINLCEDTRIEGFPNPYFIAPLYSEIILLLTNLLIGRDQLIRGLEL